MTEGMVAVDSDNIFGSFDVLAFECAESLDDNVPSPMHELL